MLQLTKPKNIQANDPIFKKQGIVSTTNFDESDDDDSLGYVCSCDIFVFSSGEIKIHSKHDNNLIENFHVKDIIIANNNINNYDPTYLTAVSLMTQMKNLTITFESKEIKNAFWNVIALK